MIHRLNLPVKLVMCPIEREPDGLAMSSRNIHLTPDDRMHALVLSRALNQAKASFTAGEDILTIQQNASALITAEPGTRLEYFELANGETLLPAKPNNASIVALVAARVGNTRLIDNVIIR